MIFYRSGCFCDCKELAISLLVFLDFRFYRVVKLSEFIDNCVNGKILLFNFVK